MSHASNFSSFWYTLSVIEGKMTVGDPVSKALLTGLAELMEELFFEDSSMLSEAIVLGGGASELGMPVGGCCFFLIMSL